MKYKFQEHRIELKDHDTDIRIVLPSGEQLIVQCRVEGPSIDLCMGDPLSKPEKTWSATCWIGPDMKPAPPGHNSYHHIRKVNQICLIMSERQYFGEL